MSEYIREVKITVYVDTNKSSYTESFSSIRAAEGYLDSIVSDCLGREPEMSKSTKRRLAAQGIGDHETD